MTLKMTIRDASSPSLRGSRLGVSGQGNGPRTSHTQTVRAAHGHAFEVKAGEHFRIVDLHGEQIVDFMAWVLPYKVSNEHLSMSYSRHHLGGSAPPRVGESLYTNKNEPIFKLIADPVKTHDMLFMACNPGMYAEQGLSGHRSCAENVTEAMRPWGMESWLEVTDPFNIFQNTPYYTLKALGCSRAGDYVEFKALKDAVCAVSSCPYDVVSFSLITHAGVISSLTFLRTGSMAARSQMSPLSPG